MSQTLRETLEGQAEWRRGIATEHPNDVRNIEAAELFDRLAATAEAVTKDLEQQFEELFTDDEGASVSEKWSQTLREVGFSRWPESASELIGDFVEANALQRLCDASNGDLDAFQKAVRNNPQFLKVMTQDFFAQNIDAIRETSSEPDPVHPDIEREYRVRLVLTDRGLRLDRTSSWDRADGTRGYKILKGQKVLAGPNYEMSLDDVEAFVAALTS